MIRIDDNAAAAAAAAGGGGEKKDFDVVVHYDLVDVLHDDAEEK